MDPTEDQSLKIQGALYDTSCDTFCDYMINIKISMKKVDPPEDCTGVQKFRRIALGVVASEGNHF